MVYDISLYVTHYSPREPYPAWCEMGYVSVKGGLLEKGRGFIFHSRDVDDWYFRSVREISLDEINEFEKEGRIIRIPKPTIIKRCQSVFLSPEGEVCIANREDPWKDSKKILIEREARIPSDLQLSAYNSYSV